MNKAYSSLGAALLLAAAGSVVHGSPDTTAAPTRHVEQPDLPALIKRVLSPQGFLDPVYAALITTPSPYYSDAWGLQAIRDVSIEQVKRDFVPRYAQLGETTEHSVELKFPAGWTATFCTPCSIRIMDNELPISHVRISGETFRDFVPHAREFRAMLRARKLETTYLIPNPAYDAELQVARRYTPGTQATPVQADPQLERFTSAKDAVLIYPDAVHGSIEPYDRLVELLHSADYDWLALEMLPSSVQAEADTFITAPEGSAAYREAREVLLKNLWKDRFVPGTPDEENHYFKLLELMRTKHKRIIGLEGVPLEYFFFGAGEVDGAGGAARNVLWARQIPASGRGILFGGSAHFTSTWPANFQDFLAISHPQLEILSITPIKPRPMQE